MNWFTGNRQVQNRRNFTKLASDSSSCSSDTVDEDSVSLFYSFLHISICTMWLDRFVLMCDIDKVLVLLC